MSIQRIGRALFLNADSGIRSAKPIFRLFDTGTVSPVPGPD
jgi:hypothetical protein